MHVEHSLEWSIIMQEKLHLKYLQFPLLSVDLTACDLFGMNIFF